MNDLVRSLPCREEGPRTGAQSAVATSADLRGFVGMLLPLRALLFSCAMWMEPGAVWAGGSWQL